MSKSNTNEKKAFVDKRSNIKWRLPELYIIKSNPLTLSGIQTTGVECTVLRPCCSP
ncbi:MAG: hypothetical protein P1U34_12485 [Coxiellaceae bacterium]|nr:hypothetical protein [Coxiellaceae bacterium]